MGTKLSKTVFFLLTLLSGIFILYPFVDYQAVMAGGDHGRDLYAAQVTLKGHLPYRDYWWVYGPLMPYYYALFFKLLGTHVPALLTAKALLSLAGALLVYTTLIGISIPSALAFLGALWFLVFPPEFFITYNHIGGLMLLLALTFLIFQYLKSPRIPLLYLGLGIVLLLSLVKLNFGATGLLSLLTAVIVMDVIYKNPASRQKKIFYGIALILLPAAIFLIYWYLLHGLPAYAIRQCLPYLGGDQPYNISVWTGVGLLMKSIVATITGGWQNLCFAVLLISAVVQSVRRLASRQIDPAERTRWLMTIGFLGLFYVLSVHEFLLSGVFYRAVWARPFAILLMFVFLDLGTRHLHKGIRVLFYAALLLMAGLQVFATQAFLKAAKTPLQYLAVERAKVFLGNQPSWIQTVTQTVDYLNENLRPDELFFALPYDPLYYFLTDKVSTTRQLIFFDHIRIPPEQEKTVLAELEKNRVNWIVLSSRQSAQEYGLGTLGKTYCPLIGEYIARNFETVAQFGDWINDPGWAWNHGVRILRRK